MSKNGTQKPPGGNAGCSLHAFNKYYVTYVLKSINVYTNQIQCKTKQLYVKNQMIFKKAKDGSIGLKMLI